MDQVLVGYTVKVHFLTSGIVAKTCDKLVVFHHKVKFYCSRRVCSSVVPDYLSSTDTNRIKSWKDIKIRRSKKVDSRRKQAAKLSYPLTKNIMEKTGFIFFKIFQ